MEPGRVRDDEVAALDAVGGHEASATAPPVPRPVRADTSEPGGPGGAAPRRAAPIVGSALAIVLASIGGYPFDSRAGAAVARPVPPLR